MNRSLPASCLLLLALASSSFAQGLPKLTTVDQLAIPGLGGDEGDHVTFVGKYRVEKGTRNGHLAITASLDEGWHVYSITQPDGGPTRSELKVAESDDFEITGPFQPDVAPDVKPPKYFPVASEEHKHEVTWTAPIRLKDGVDPGSLKPDVKYSGQVCRVKCIPIEGQLIEVAFDGFYESVSLSHNYRDGRSHVEFVGELVPNVARPGDVVTLSVTATPDEGWHIYAYGEEDHKLISKPTLISISQPVGWVKTKVAASDEPIKHVHEPELPEEPVVFFHEQPVTWKVEIQVPKNAEPGEYDLQGGIAYQTCTLLQCDKPTAATFSSKLTVTTRLTEEANQVGFAAGSSNAYDEIASQVAKPAPAEPEPVSSESEAGEFVIDKVSVGDDETGGQRPAIGMLLTAFVAGFILNFMPCVLPVIGLKLASFVNQAGQDRGRILRLNLWYTVGVMAVFMVLATAATVFGLKWGSQFNNAMFNAILASIVFAFALSFLGVWEIPLPGFASSGKMNELAEQEGAGGAFFKGILTTVLATPCSGPLLVPAVAWALKQPPVITYSSFACVGLGLASPYLVIGAFPRLGAFLPKPGPWMDTFKNIMGFVLLGTVVFLLTFIPMSHVVPVVTFLMGLWATLWWIGRVPLYEPLNKRIRVWAEGAIFAAVIYAFAFGWLQGVMEGRFNEAIAFEVSRQGDGTMKVKPKRHEHELDWQPYSAELLEQAVNARKTVFVDFTAPS